MPDITLTISAEEVIVLNSFYPTAEEGLIEIGRRRIKSLANTIVQDSTSQKDPNKLSQAELRAEISALNTSGEIPTYAERNPDIS